MDYAPPIFGLFGVCYGIAIALAQTTLVDPTRWDLYWGFLLLAIALCIAVPVGGYVAWSYWRNGENGLKSYEGAA
jgi:hypothetical protein